MCRIWIIKPVVVDADGGAMSRARPLDDRRSAIGLMILVAAVASAAIVLAGGPTAGPAALAVLVAGGGALLLALRALWLGRRLS